MIIGIAFYRTETPAGPDAQLIWHAVATVREAGQRRKG